MKPRATESLRCWKCNQDRNDPDGEAQRAYARAYNARLRVETFNAYGNSCSCCGETESTFLTLDHLDGVPGGRPGRATGGYTVSGYKLYKQLKAAGFPKDDPKFGRLRVLCMNCNFGRRMNGGVCPHELDLAFTDRSDSVSD